MRTAVFDIALTVAIAVFAPLSAQASASLTPAAGKLAREQPIPPEALDTFVDGVVRSAMDAEDIAGVSVAIVQNGAVALLKGYGIAGVDPVRAVDPARTMFRIGSLSKTFTWVLLMQEIEQGRVELHAPVNDYLPPALRVPDQGFDEPIRIVDLFSHAAGFEDRILGHIFTTRDGVISLDDYLVRHRPDRVREPGVLSTYSNYGAALAGAIVAHLNGTDFETVVERKILAPLGMTRTTFREPYPAKAGLPAPMSAQMAQTVSAGFSWTGAYFKPEEFEYVSQLAPAGAASATAADMARYMLMFLNDGTVDSARIYGAEAARFFRTPIMGVPEGINGWAGGLVISTLPGGFTTYDHGGSTINFRTAMTLIPELGLGVYVASNTGSGRALADRLPRLIVERFYAPASTELAADPSLVKDAERYVGTYVATRRAYSGLEKFTWMIGAQSAVAVTPDGYLMAGGGGAIQAWVPDGALGRFRAVQNGKVLAFDLDESGRAVSYREPRGTLVMERVDPLLNVRLLNALALLTLAAALWTLFSNSRRLLRKAYVASSAKIIDRVSLATAVLWLLGFSAMAASLGDSEPILQFPGPLLLTASIASLLSVGASVALLLLLPLVWRNREDWSRLAATAHSCIVALFLVFGGLLGAWGLLAPWA